MAFIKERDAETVDSSWGEDWDIILSVLKRAIMGFGLFIVEEWGLPRDGVVERNGARAGRGDVYSRAFIVGVGKRDKIGALGWISPSRLIWILTDASFSGVSRQLGIGVSLAYN